MEVLIQNFSYITLPMVIMWAIGGLLIYLAIAKEMDETGSYATVMINGDAAAEIPPMAYWLTAGSFKLFGQNAFANRLPSALAVGLTALFIALLIQQALRDEKLAALAAMLYLVVGYRPVAEYFLLPFRPEGAAWAVLVITVAGGFGGYLWFNAEPSKILMGDAGSRFLGMLVGAAVLVAGNPFLVLALSPIVLVNGGGGLAKLVLLRLAKRCGFDIGEDAAIRKIRFPLHDHCKKNLGWSNAQVLMRFTLLQLVIMPVLLLVIIKVR